MTELDRVRFDGDRICVSASGQAPWAFELAQVRHRMLWAFDDSGPQARRGHAYLIEIDGGPLQLLRLAHGEVEHDDLMALVERVSKHLQIDADPDRRGWRWWQPPSGSQMSFTHDAGAFELQLRDRALVHRSGPHYAAIADWPGLPEAFLRDPIGRLVFAEVGAVTWPASLGAAALCPRVHGLRVGECVVMTAGRYGSRFAEIGQDRTAAVFVSHDGGSTFTELPWRLDVDAQLCWPPEQIDRVRVTPMGEGAVIEIEWDDPWIMWDPGTEWAARWSPGAGSWKVRAR